MKKTVLLLAVFFLSACAFAQQKQDRNQTWKKEMDRIHSEKIAFFTKELDLTPEEASVFWPVYQQYWKDSQKAHWQTRKAYKAIKHQLSGQKTEDAQYQNLVEAYLQALTAEQNILNGYYPKFKAVLTDEKVAGLIVAEENFRMMILRDIQKRSSRQSKNIDSK